MNSMSAAQWCSGAALECAGIFLPRVRARQRCLGVMGTACNRPTVYCLLSQRLKERLFSGPGVKNQSRTLDNSSRRSPITAGA
ncbi:hypothetical protein PoB_002320800 [Plakobranchus ocellatus]|uniref:Secreted protein n=1 Tax=Plakobranchus ocellatus TaxID=259542 RepID=A0AAV3ZQ68_9GAST|nr:hypothetical protein PoB_002320800 [Plakobranchus ocellatus]